VVDFLKDLAARKKSTPAQIAIAWLAMTHIAIAELLDGKAVDWTEGVTNEQYGA
jgi:aryl-alcohol dehydrogenase-like predicted oxidoreductase